MKFVLAMVLAMFSGMALAQEILPDHPESNIAVGISNGSHNGLSVAYAPHESDQFYQGTLSMTNDASYLAVDSLFLQPQLTDSMALTPYFGLGVSVSETYKAQKIKVGDMEAEIGKDVHEVALRVPVGLLMKVPNLPIQVGMEVAPVLPVAPKGKSTMDTALNLRVIL